MVDLVKIRKKASEKKKRQGEKSPADAAAATRNVEPVERLARYKQRLEERRESIRRAAEVAESGSGTAVGTIEVLAFVIGGEEYAIPIESVVEIVESPVLTRVPNAGGDVIGIVSLRGTIVTVLDLCGRLGHARTPYGADSRLIVVNDQGGTSGFIADRVSRVVVVESSAVESSPSLTPAEGAGVNGGVFRRNDGLTVLLDLERILSL